jgi:hypothetical protein
VSQSRTDLNIVALALDDNNERLALKKNKERAE